MDTPKVDSTPEEQIDVDSGGGGGSSALTDAPLTLTTEQLRRYFGGQVSDASGNLSVAEARALHALVTGHLALPSGARLDNYALGGVEKARRVRGSLRVPPVQLFISANEPRAVQIADYMLTSLRCYASVQLLYLGDVHVVHYREDWDDGQNEYPYEVLSVIERKKVADFSSSIKDGRYHDQVARALDDGVRMIYLVVGSLEQLTSEQRTKVMSAQSHLVFPLGTPFAVLNVIDDAAALRALAKAVVYCERALNDADGRLGFPMASIQKTGKRRTADTPDTFYERFTEKLPGVGGVFATAIRTRYPTLHSLMDAYKHCSAREESDLLLADLPCTMRTGAVRRFGNAKSRAVSAVLCADSLSGVALKEDKKKKKKHKNHDSDDETKTKQRKHHSEKHKSRKRRLTTPSEELGDGGATVSVHAHVVADAGADDEPMVV